MKKNRIIAAALLTVMLLGGCGKNNHAQVAERIFGEQAAIYAADIR